MTDICEEVDGVSSRLNDGPIMQETAQVLQFNSLITIAKQELAIILKNLLNAGFEWEKLYFIKQAHLTIHEVLKTYTAHNKKLREISLRSSMLSTEFADLQIELKAFRKKAETANTNAIRNCTAHIDKDFKKYYDTLREVDAAQSLRLTADFIMLLDKWFIFSTQCLEVDALSSPDLEQLETKMADFRIKLFELSENIKINSSNSEI